MARLNKWGFFLLAAGSIFLTNIAGARADTLTPSMFVANTSATFTAINIYYVDDNPLANPWSLTSTCSAGCNPNPIGSDSTTPFTSETVTLRDTSAINGSGLDVMGGVFIIHLYGNSALFVPGTDNAPQISDTAGDTISYSSSSDVFCAQAACNNGSDPAVPFTLAMIAPDVFTATSSSLEIAFSLPSSPISTPEPSSFCMLGLGLVGLVGFSLIRFKNDTAI